MSRTGWDDFQPDEREPAEAEREEPVEEPSTLRSGEELARELEHWIDKFEGHMDSSIEEGWVHLRLELGPLLNLLATMRGAAWVLRVGQDHRCGDGKEER